MGCSKEEDSCKCDFTVQIFNQNASTYTITGVPTDCGDSSDYKLPDDYNLPNDHVIVGNGFNCR